MEQESLVNRKRKSVLPVLRERQQLVDSLGRILPGCLEGHTGRIATPIRSEVRHLDV